MADLPGIQEYNRVTIGTASIESVGSELVRYDTDATESIWTTTNKAIFVPFVVYTTITVVKMAVVNGSAVSGNVDIGIYDTEQNRLVSKGSTAQTPTNAIQEFDITDTTLQPGVYYMALNCSNTTGRFRRWVPAIGQVRAMGVLNQAVGAVTLPNPAVFAAATDAYVPDIWVTQRTVI